MQKTEINQNLIGVISAHPRGFGFVSCEDGQSFFVPPPQMKTLVPGDSVRFNVTPNPRNQQLSAVVQEVLNRPETFWLGQLVSGQYAVEGETLFTADEAITPQVRLSGPAPKLAPGSVIQVRLSAGADIGRSRLTAEFVQDLGPRDDRDFDVRYAIAKWRLPSEFTAEALAQAKCMDEPSLAEGTALGMRDLTAVPLVTIDGPSTRDFDDAVGFVKEGATNTLYVAIAHVSHYVRPGTALDNEAKKRGTSVYMSDRVLPMLPPQLSTGLCSLNPDALRYAMVCALKYSQDGKLLSSEFFEAVIRSAGRLTYEQVSTNCESIGPKAMLADLWVWFEQQQAQRAQRGLMDYNREEPKLSIKESGEYGLEWVEAFSSNQLIEECMLAANRAAASRIRELGKGQLFRHQAGLEEERWEEARAWLETLGIAAPVCPTLSDLRGLLNLNLPAEVQPQLEFRIRRSMTPASYDAANSSHFSLGFDEYTHFTSPIRRYADLMVHRLLAGTADVADEEVHAHLVATSKAARQASRFPWERLKRRLAWRSGEREHQAQLVAQTPKSVKAAVAHWDILVAIDATDLAAKGYAWDKELERWVHPNGHLDVGMPIKLQLLSLKDEGSACELAAGLVAA